MNQFNSAPGQNNGTKEAENKYDSMSFDQLEADPVAGPVLQRVALEFLKKSNPEVFITEYTGQVDSEGYLETRHKDLGQTKPSQNIGGGDPMMQVIKMTRLELKKNKE